MVLALQNNTHAQEFLVVEIQKYSGQKNMQSIAIHCNPGIP